MKTPLHDRVGPMKNSVRYLSRFSIVGVGNTLLDFCMFTLLHEFVGLGSLISQVVGYSCGVGNSFIWNKRWTFVDRKEEKKLSKEGFQFIMVNALSLILSLLLMKLLVQSEQCNVYLAKIIVTVVVQCTNFIGYKVFVFT